MILTFQLFGFLDIDVHQIWIIYFLFQKIENLISINEYIIYISVVRISPFKIQLITPDKERQ